MYTLIQFFIIQNILYIIIYNYILYYILLLIIKELVYVFFR